MKVTKDILIYVGEQSGDVVLWALVELESDTEKATKRTMTVDVVATGHPIFVGERAYVGTVVMQTTPFVWHVFVEQGVL